MPQRLRELSQNWGELVVRGFNTSAQAQIDKNNRQAGVVSDVANAIGSAIVRKKGRDREDKLRAEENTREDAIRRERYGREDARHAVEDGRYQEQRRYKQAELDLDAIKMTQAEMAAAAQEAGSPDPQTQMAAQAKMEGLQGRLSTLQSRYLQLTGAGQPEPVAEPASTLGMASPEDVARAGGMDAIAKSNQRFHLGAPGPTPADRPKAAAPAAPAAAAVTPPGATPVDGMPPPVSREEQVANAYTQRRLDAETRYTNEMTAADEATQRARDSNKSPKAERDWQIKAKAHLDAANAAQREAAALKTNEAAWGEKAKAARVAQAQQTEQKAAIVEVMNQAKAWGPRAIGGFAKGWAAGVRDPAALKAFAVGAMKDKEWEEKQKAKAPTIPVDPVERAAYDRALVDAREAQGLDDEGNTPTIAKPGKDLALARLGMIDKDRMYKKVDPSEPLDTSLLSDEQILSLEKNPNVPQAYVDDIAKAANEIRVRKMVGSVKYSNPFGGGKSTTASPDARSAASAELKALPPEQQTPEAWAAIKKKHKVQ